MNPEPGRKNQTAARDLSKFRARVLMDELCPIQWHSWWMVSRRERRQNGPVMNSISTPTIEYYFSCRATSSLVDEDRDPPVIGSEGFGIFDHGIRIPSPPVIEDFGPSG